MNSPLPAPAPGRVQFAGRQQAGQLLAERLAAMPLAADPVVLALPRGGVPVGAAIAARLRAPVDLLLVRKIGLPWQPELALAAVVEGSPPGVVVNEAVLSDGGVDRDFLDWKTKEATQEMARRRALYLGGRAAVPVAGRCVIVVDDGLATGTTMRAALRALRERGAAQLVVAVPVAPVDTVEQLRHEADLVVCLEQPVPFIAIGDHYADFHQLSDDEVLAAFDAAAPGDIHPWLQARALLGLAPSGGPLNIAALAVDRPAAGPAATRCALRWLGQDGRRRDITYAELAERSNRFANVLSTRGLAPGDGVFLLCGRVPELPIAMLGALKHRCVVTPLFSAFGPEPIATRMRLGQARLLVTTASLYRRKVASLRATLPALAHVLLIPDDDQPLPPDTADLRALLDAASPDYRIAPTDPQTPALLHFTSGTTGLPKGAQHVHEAIVAHVATARIALDLRKGDVYWCTADPGWVTGTSYGILAPLALGATLVIDEAEFDAERWYRTVADEGVNVWYTAPTAVRMMMRGGAAAAQAHRCPALRFIASVGEPLNPQAVQWGREAFGLPIHDNWWQTETGAIMIANRPGLPIRPGSMGRPLPGVDAAIVQRQPDGSLRFIDDPSTEGELALRRGWPSMFRGYLNDEARYRKCFVGDWYLTGDLARRDAEGYFWFVGRADDMIKSSGHFIGPFEVESTLMEHAAVAEAGVIGRPEPTVGEIVKAFVVLRPGIEPTEALRRELLGFARTRLGAVVAPKEITFAPALPRTRSGKIMRRLLRARELGLPEGDTSTLEAA
ncbi:acetate--CoA ligase [Aquabacterium humicola]|uniref:acetate--CoA ligase n=1 Tax=Aquabacterium humicola TaxID=3237377 RepID=UPI0025426F93|nr:acetate--CoA ligase [Rubrivivax pictus]